jgi:CubicO group peptidase (beta-lactamase class C family)
MDDKMRRLKKTTRMILSALSGLTLLSACAPAPVKPAQISHGDYEYAKKYLTWLIGREMKKNDVTGLSIALVDDQRVVWAQGFGYADKNNNVAASAETVYRVGSISKLFTASAAMQLAEQGRMDIDRPLADYLPGFSIRTRFEHVAPITPRSIMTHHSGLPGDRVKGMWSRNPGLFTDLESEIRDEYAAYPPNYVFAYSNLGVSLLGDAVGKVGGGGFSAYMDEYLLQPMGMTHSSFTAKAEAPGMAKPYRDGQETEEYGLRDVPAGGLNSSVLDLSRFMAMVFADGSSDGHRILKRETLTEMLRPQNMDVPLDLNFRIGLGWMLGGLVDMDIRNAGPVAHHAGGTFNYHSQLIVLPQHRLGVIVLSNSSSSLTTVNRVATEAIKVALESKTGIRQPPDDNTDVREASLPAETLQSYAGYYATVVGLVRVSHESGGLRATVGDTTLRLVPGEDGQLRLKYKLMGLIPINLGGLGQVGLSRAHIGGREVFVGKTRDQEMLVGEKLSPASLPPALRDYLGEYEPINIGEGEAPVVKRVRIKYEDGLLIAEVSQTLPFELAASLALASVADDQAIVAGLGRGMGETIRFATKGVERHAYFAGLELKMAAKP